MFKLKTNKLQVSLMTSLLLSSMTMAKPQTLELKLSPKITVSGVSSGGYMANQMHVAHADKISGAGIVAAGPYRCSAGNLMVAMKQCLADGSALAEQDLQSDINNLSKNNKVAAPENLKGDRVWLLHGTLDNRVGASVTEALHTQYQGLVTEQNIQFVADKAFNHGLPAKDFGVDCTTTTTPFISNCNYDTAQEIMAWLNPNSTPEDNKTHGQLYKVAQNQEVDGRATGLAQHGWLYVPEACQSGAACDLHISFHGCQQNEATIGSDYIVHGGFNAAADKYNQVVLYPQTASNNPLNPLACWDWWGYTGEDFAEQSGPQISTVMALVGSLQSNTQLVTKAQKQATSATGAAQ